MSALSIEQNLERLAEAQERTATALEAILAHLGSGTSLIVTTEAMKTTLTGADVVHAQAESEALEDQAVATALAASEAEAKKKAAAAAAKKKADEAAAAAKKKADEEAAAAAAAAAEVDPLADTPAEVKKEITIEDVRKALMDYRAIEGAPAMMEVLKTHGKAESLNAVKPENFEAILKAVNVK